MQVFVVAGTVPREKQSKATKMSILDLGPYMFRELDQQIGCFQSKGLLGTSKTCPACSQPMDMQARSDVTDKYRWRCSNTARRKVPGRVNVAGTSWKHCLHSSGKSVSGHCTQVPRLKNVGFHIVPSVVHISDSFCFLLSIGFYKNHQLSKSFHQVSCTILQRQKFAHMTRHMVCGCGFLQVTRHMVCGCGFLQLCRFWTS